MGALKVLVNCPGGWSHGLDSPERGEGRWAQNLVRCLAKSGQYKVFACSGGEPTWGQGDVIPNVSILSEREAHDRGPYDLHFDAAWYDNKKPAAKAHHNFHVHFGYEPRLGVPFPSGHYLVYVLKRSAPDYFGEGRGNADRTFYLPAPFSDVMTPPDPRKRKIIHTMRGSDAPNRAGRFEKMYEAVSRLRREGVDVPMVWISSAGLEHPRHPLDQVLVGNAAWGIPYNHIRKELRECGLNAALDGWSNILDSTVLGVPSLAWAGGVDGTAGEEARQYDLQLNQDSSAEDVYEVIRRLFSDENLYTRYTESLQRAFSDHLEHVTLAKFQEIVSKVIG